MVLYHVLSAYQLLEAMEHRKIVHRDEPAVLLIYNFMGARYPHYMELVSMGFFDEVYIYPHWRIPFRPGQNVPEQAKLAFTSTVSHDITEFDKIYVAGIHVAFTTWLLEEGIRFCIFEDGSGALSRPYILEEIEKKADPTKYEVIRQFGLYYPCEFGRDKILEKYCDMRAQLPEFEDELARDFNLVEQFQCLDTDSQEKILRFFRCPKNLECEPDAVLLLTQHFANLEQLSFEEHVYIYQVLFDYFLEGRQVILKLHPDDNMYYKKLFPGVPQIREKFPAELLPFLFHRCPKTIATITSTGINNIKGLFEEQICFTPEFEKNFHKIRNYYAAVQLCQFLRRKSVRCVGTDPGMMKYLLRQCDIEECENAEVLLIGDGEEPPEADLNEAGVIMKHKGGLYSAKLSVFINNETKYFWDYMDHCPKEAFIPIVLKVEKKREEDNYFTKEAVIYAASEDGEVREQVKRFEFEKVEKYSGNVVKTEKLTEEEIRIRVLEGMLEATERRLLYYKQKATEGKASDET